MGRRSIDSAPWSGTRRSQIIADMPSSLSKPALLILLAACCVGCDQGTKLIATEHLEGGAPRSYLFGTVRLVYAENAGAFLGLGSGLSEELRNLLAIATAAMVIGVFWMAIRGVGSSMAHSVSFALVAAGGASNLIDRALNDGRVIDFMVVGLGGLRTGVFNVADMAITSGALLLIALAIVQRHRPEEDPADPS